MVGQILVRHRRTLLVYKIKMIKFILGWLAVMAVRLIPGRPANFEPMLAAVMPYSASYSRIQSFLFGFLGIIVFDLISNKVGMWTLITAVAYGLLGLASAIYFANHEASVKNFVFFGAVGTVVYDAVTGLSIGPIFYGQPFMEALIGQVPFTLMHLVGTTFFALVLSPVILRFIVRNEKFEVKNVLKLV